ncbi:MAG: hypothetical protein H6598_01695 [Flavobacteriales bacterium]|nr:hypothetical protein [Flavobacteriales bacterium]
MLSCTDSAEMADKEACMNCNDIFLDPMYNHFYTDDRTKPYTGKCQSKSKSGQIILEKNFVEGKLEGKWLEYYENGTIKSEWEFSKNRQHGNLKGYSVDGTLEYHSVYNKGELESSIYP